MPVSCTEKANSAHFLEKFIASTRTVASLASADDSASACPQVGYGNLVGHVLADVLAKQLLAAGRAGIIADSYLTFLLVVG